jgi:UDP-N-acetylmuramoyl-tripeptide--D-alanyl-D-alanine ligase
MKKAAPKFSVEEVLTATGGEVISNPSSVKTFCGICTDSRVAARGNLFVALKGEKFDGHDFVRDALDREAAGVLIHDEEKVLPFLNREKTVIIRVGDTLTALGDLAHHWRKKFSTVVIALTGSSGKTTTKEMIASIMSRKKNILKTEGNLNNLIGLPQTIFGMTKQHEAVILEMGTNTRGEIKRLTQIASPDIGLITNVGPAHLAGLGSLEAVRDEKCDLFLNMSRDATAVVNLDDEAVVAGSESWDGKRVTFSMGTGADVTAAQIEKQGLKGISFHLVIGGRAKEVVMKIAGMHHVYNALAAAATAFAAGMEMETIAEGLAAFTPFSGRMEVIKLQNGAYLLDDSYNANPASVREALMALKDLKGHHSGYVFLGDMLELGSHAEEMHRKIGMLIATVGITALFLQGDFSPMTAAGAIEGGLASENIFFLPRQDQEIDFLKTNLKKGDWILVKGSRRMKMEHYVHKICEAFGCDRANHQPQSAS